MSREIVLTLSQGDALQHVIDLIDTIARHPELPPELGSVSTLAYQVLRGYQEQARAPQNDEVTPE